jgi:pSer/pThr/pTyr-binding forkhead associated (FHA) protein
MEQSLQIRLGRSAELNDVVVNDSSVSRTHLKLEVLTLQNIILTDLGSRHGSFVWDGEKWQNFQQIQATGNDYVFVGNTKLRIMEIIIAYQIKQRVSA